MDRFDFVWEFRNAERSIRGTDGRAAEGVAQYPLDAAARVETGISPCPFQGTRLERQPHSAAPLPHLEKSRIPQPAKGSNPRRPLALLGLILLVLGIAAERADAIRGVLNYPKTLTYSSEINNLTDAERDSLAWHDIIVLMGRRDHYNTLRLLREEQAGNRELRFLYQLMPQIIPYWDGQPAAWIPDTLRSPYRKMMFYARMNDWYLYDTSGNRIPVGDDVMLNWTPHCPVGTFGDSKGLRVAEWYARTLAQITVEGRGWDAPWRWNEFAGGTPNGLIFEVYLDCWGSLQTMPTADPDRDGIAEGVTRNCTSGGYAEPLTLLIAQESEIFWSTIHEMFPSDFVLCIQSNNQYDGPTWRDRANGMKFENWMRPGYGRPRTWWDYFYGGLRPGGDGWDVGYRWTELNLEGAHESIPDGEKGWDLSFIETWQDGTPAQYQQLKRFGLGTVLLGDGYYCHTKDQVKPQWEPEFDWDFGTPLEPFWRNMATPTDTVYVRRFSKGMVEVNPNAAARMGIPAKDSRFTFWMPVQDLAATAEAQGTIRLRWTIPDGENNDADSYDLRYADVPITLESWDAATAYQGNPLEGSPGEAMDAAIEGLAPQRTYYFALRGTTRGQIEPVLSNIAQETTLGEDDETPPSPIQDFVAIREGQNWIQFEWTAPGDDGGQGRSTRYHLRYLSGETIQDETDWSVARAASGLPTPRAAGTRETYTLHGLVPDRDYGVAIRAEDEAHLLGALSPAYLVRTLPESQDTVPPSAVTDLSGRRGGPGAILLSWTAPGDDGPSGRAARYEIRYLLGTGILTEEDWNRATGVPNPPAPAPGGTPESWNLTGLVPDSVYGIAIRAWDDADLRSALSDSTLATAGALDDSTGSDEDTIPPAPVRSLTGIATDHDTAILTWISTGDDGYEGTADHYELRILAGERMEDEADWSRGTTPQGIALPEPLRSGSYQNLTIEGLRPLTWYGALVRTMDSDGNRSLMASGVYFQTLSAPPPPDTTAPDPVADLRAVAADTSSITLAWTAPMNPGEAVPPERYEMRRATGALADDRIWPEGTAVPGLPAPILAGGPQSVTVQGLASGTEYAFLLRSCDDSGNWAEDSNALRASTAKPPDPPDPPAPPAPIRDLLVPETEQTSATLFWTAPGDDGDEGLAARYVARIRTGGAFLTEEDWNGAATPDTTGLPRPSAAGSEERWTLGGLAADTVYGVCVRAVDDSGLVGGLSNPTSFRTEAPPPPPLPTAVRDLACPERGTTWLVLSWSSPSCGDAGNPAASYAIAVRPGSDAIEEATWESATVIDSGLPGPADPGEQETVRLDSFLPDSTYTFALRSRNIQGQFGPISNPVHVRTEAIPDTEVIVDRPPAPIRDLVSVGVGEDFIELAWTAVGEDSLTGQASAYDLRIRPGSEILTQQDWDAAHPVVEGIPSPAPAGTLQGFHLTGLDASTAYGICLRALDAAHNYSPLAGSIRVVTSDPDAPPLEEPPAPVENLTATPVAADSVVLAWTATGSSTDPNGPLRYLLAVASVPPSLGTWGAGIVDSVSSGTTLTGDPLSFRYGGLDPDATYYASARVRGRTGLLSPLSNVATFSIARIDLAPPQPPSGVTVEAAGAEGSVVVAWTASPDPDVAGYLVYGSETMRNDWVLLTAGAVPAAQGSVPVAAGYALYAVSAVDGAGNESALSHPTAALADELRMEGPFPHPIVGECRFLLSVPPDRTSERAVFRMLDLLGHEVRVLYEGRIGPGPVEVRWDRKNAAGDLAAPGFYLVRFEVGSRKLQKRIFVEP